MLKQDITEQQAALQAFLAKALDVKDLRIVNMSPVPHGVHQDNVALVVQADSLPAERRHLIVRCDACPPRSVHGRAQEFAIVKAAALAGVKVPTLLALCTDPSVIGRAFYVMEHVPGIALPNRLVREEALVPDRAALVRSLGENLARIHSIAPGSQGLAFLGAPTNAAQTFVDACRAHLDALPLAQPAFELGLRWCERNAPKCEKTSLVHRDFRTGNFLVHVGELAAVLDWEHARFGDPMEDIGWFFARCWRFGRPDREAGGIGPSNAFFQGYQELSGVTPSADAIHFWEVAAHIRWGITAMQQAQRHMLGTQPSLELALNGRMPSELAHNMLRLMSEAFA